MCRLGAMPRDKQPCPNESGVCVKAGCQREEAYYWYGPDDEKMCKPCYEKAARANRAAGAKRARAAVAEEEHLVERPRAKATIACQS